MATTTSSHQLAVAKASLLAALLRPTDLQVCSRDDLNAFYSSLDRALSSCTSTNIQTCKRWVLAHVAASSARTTSLGKFLIAQSATLDKRRKKLYLLYLVHDVLHHTTVNQPDGRQFADAIQPSLEQLFSAAMYPGAVKQRQKILRLLGLWREHGYYPTGIIDGLEKLVNEIADTSPNSSDSAAAAASKKKDEPSILLLPSTHGDPSIPFYDLPVGSLFPHIPKDVVRPINAKAVKPYQFQSITPSGSVSTAVQDFLAKVERTWDPASRTAGEPDPVGGIDDKDDPSGGESYYGWSKRFCELMRKRKKDALEREREVLERKSGRGRESERRSGRRRSYSRSSRSSSSRSRSRSRSRNSPVRDRHRDGDRRRHDHSRDSGRDRSASPPRNRAAPAFKQFQPPSSYDTPPPQSSAPPRPSQPSSGPPPPPPVHHQKQSQRDVPTQHQPQQQPFMQFPPPPPFPVQQQPGWFPPPPPPPPMQQGFPMPALTPEQLQQLQMGAAAMGWLPNAQFAPPPPPQQQQQNQGYPGPEKSTDPRKR